MNVCIMKAIQTFQMLSLSCDLLASVTSLYFHSQIHSCGLIG